MHRTFRRSIVNSFITAISTSLHLFCNKYNFTFPMLDVIRTKYFPPLRTRSTEVFIKYKYTILFCKIICATICSYLVYYHYVVIEKIRNPNMNNREVMLKWNDVNVQKFEFKLDTTLSWNVASTNDIGMIHDTVRHAKIEKYSLHVHFYWIYWMYILRLQFFGFAIDFLYDLFKGR